MASLLDDEWVAKQIDDVVAEFAHLWTEDQIRAFREMAAWTIATNPKARALVERERVAHADKSGTRSKTSHADDIADEERKGAAR